MGIDVWQVIDAAATKPFGFQAFYPGPGSRRPLHSDRSVLSHLEGARIRVESRFIELAGHINTGMPGYVVTRLMHALNERAGRAVKGRRCWCSAWHTSPMSTTSGKPVARADRATRGIGRDLRFHDPHIPVVPPTRAYAALADRRSVPLTAEELAGYDAVLIATDHEAVDYGLVAGMRH